MKLENGDCNGEKKRDAFEAEIDSLPSLSSSSSGDNKVTIEEIEYVQNLVERCLVLYLTKDEATAILVNQANIKQDFIHLVWENLEEENPEFFKAYEARIELKKQIISYNQLLEKQYHMMKNLEHYDKQQCLNYGHSNMPVISSSIGFPAEQLYLPCNGGTNTNPPCNGSIKHVVNGTPNGSNFYSSQQNGDAAIDNQLDMARGSNAQSFAELNEFLNTTNDWMNFEGVDEFLNTSDWMNFEDCLVANLPSEETQIQTDKEDSKTG